MPEISKTHMGGTMRLGLRPTVFEPGTESWSKARKLYGGAGTIWERHRHRYEVNPEYVERLHASGLLFVGKDEKGERMQLMELRGASPASRPGNVARFADICVGIRPSFLRRTSSTSRILHAASEPVPAVPRICGGILWYLGFGRAVRAPGAVFQPATPGRRDGKRDSAPERPARRVWPGTCSLERRLTTGTLPFLMLAPSAIA